MGRGHFGRAAAVQPPDNLGSGAHAIHRLSRTSIIVRVTLWRFTHVLVLLCYS